MVKKSIKISRAPSKLSGSPFDDLLENVSPMKVGKIFTTNADKPPLLLEKFRPAPKTCIDYNISETYLRWQVGDTRIRATEIHANYVPAPPGYFKPKIESEMFHGGPPVWVFLDEILKAKIEKQQIRNKKEFKRFLKEKNAKKNQMDKFMHDLITSFAGPVWFQELSPTQLRNIDKLQECIFKDLKRNTIDHVKRNMEELGLYFQDPDKTLKIALEFCCAIDVEFLLILYQVSNPKRKHYSLKDRLLLSAVVHLTIIETLRECHVRMPSPPRKTESKCRCKPCLDPRKNRDFCSIYNPPKIKYESPYLIPYTYKRPPPKFSGIYENKHIQHPQSQYFAYLENLREEIKNAESVLEIKLVDMLDPDEREFFEDMQNAERLYNKLPHKSWKCLVRPTIKVRCMDFINKGGFVTIDLPPLFPLEDTIPPCTCLDVDTDDSECCIFFKCECNNHPKYKCICRENTKDYLKSFCKRCQITRKKDSNNIVSGIVNFNGEAIPIIQGIFKDQYCQCLERFKNQLCLVSKGNKMSCQEEKFVIGGVANTRYGPAYIISAAVGDQRIFDQINEGKKEVTDKICTCNRKGEDITECFMDDFAKKTEHRMEEEQTVDEAPEPSGVVMPWETAECSCKKALDEFLKRQCQCPDCLENTRPEKAMYIVSGVISRTDDDGKVENIVNISGVQQRRCDCLHNFLEKIKEMEEYRARVKARLQMKSLDNKFKIDGVTMSKFGPVYNIKGVQLPIQCKCLEDHQKEEAKRGKAEMPNTGRIKYGIGGVSAKGEENVYEITHALPVKPCSCENVFDKYRQQHACCLESYKDYLKKTMEEIKFMEEEVAATAALENEAEYLNNLEDEIHEEKEEEEMELLSDDQLNNNNKKMMPRGDVCACRRSQDSQQTKEKNIVQTIANNRNRCACQASKDKYDKCSCQSSKDQNKGCSCQKMARDNAKPSAKDDGCTCQKGKEKSDKCSCQPSKDQNEGCSCQKKLIENVKPSAKGCSCQRKETDDAKPSAKDNGCNCQESKGKSNKCSCQQSNGQNKDCSCKRNAKNYVKQSAKVGGCSCQKSKGFETINESCTSSNSIEKEETCTCQSSSEETNESKESSKKNVCSCASEEEIADCNYDEPETENEEFSVEEYEDYVDECICLEEEVEEELQAENMTDIEKYKDEMLADSDFKRFFIMKKIPCNKGKQTELLKKVLKSLELDGYPLAKLPECHKLPIFRLWMYLRCGKNWSQRQKRGLNQQTNKYLPHIVHCYKQIKQPKITIDPNKNYTWNHFEYLRKLTSGLITKYKNKIKKQTLNSSREYFPILFDYPCPFWTFRDCFFSYLPAKKQDIYVGHYKKNVGGPLKNRDMTCFTFENKK